MGVSADRAWGWGVLVLGLVLVGGWGCGSGGSAWVTGPGGGATVETAERRVSAERSVTLPLRDRFLYEHNAQFFGSRTFRWNLPIPIFVLTGDPAFDGPLTAQFAAWEAALGRRLFEMRAASPTIPSRGIFFAVDQLPGDVIGFANVLDAPISGWFRGHFRQLPRLTERRHLEIPEIQSDGQIRRCQILLDEETFGDASSVFLVVRHEIGHCLGFLGHVPSGLMVTALHSPTFSPTITTDVSGMLRRLYKLPPRTSVTP